MFAHGFRRSIRVGGEWRCVADEAGPLGFQCEHCGQVVGNRGALTAHERWAHSNCGPVAAPPPPEALAESGDHVVDEQVAGEASDALLSDGLFSIMDLAVFRHGFRCFS